MTVKTLTTDYPPTLMTRKPWGRELYFWKKYILVVKI